MTHLSKTAPRKNTPRKTAAVLLAALALGGGLIASTQGAAAKPFGWHGHHGHHHHYRPWHGGYGVVAIGYGGPRCRVVERVNRYGDVVLRRVCYRPTYY